jgi:hypothetical protein
MGGSMETTIGWGPDVELIEVKSPVEEYFREIPSICYDVSVVLPLKGAQQEREITDEELRKLVSQSKTYDFWNNEIDDIYSISDGAPL